MNSAIQSSSLARTRERMGSVFTPNQVLGRSQPIGCTAVEITQRCNLDCTLCYLSEHSESVNDIPIEAIYSRLDSIRETYGARVHVQITGGDPTLRKHSELIEVVRYARRIGLYPALFTNGIAASRKLLEQLHEAGLEDIAFHVDTTQQRKGFETEKDLNAVRDEYLARCEGLGLSIIFNTTVHDGNIDELPELIQYFVAVSDRVNFVSFQLQAETGRGEWGARGGEVSVPAVRNIVNTIAGRKLPWDAIRIGHPDCHSYMPTLTIGKEIVPVVRDVDEFSAFMRDFAQAGVDRHMPVRTIAGAYLRVALSKPRWLVHLFARLFTILRTHGRDLLATRGRFNRLSFFVHNFMDASELDPERIAACSFMVMTEEGPVSMCEHNARRDEIILKPITIRRRDGSAYEFKPLESKQPRNSKPANSVEAFA